MGQQLGILTERLLLRPVELGDAAAVAAMMTPRIASQLTTWPHRIGVADAMQRIAQSRRLAAAEERTDWGVFLKQDLMLIGWVGLGQADIASGPLALGYWIGETFQQQRYGTEAVTAIVDCAAELFGSDAIEAFTLPHNVPSIRILKRLEFDELGRSRCLAPARNRMEELVHFGRAYDGHCAEPQRLTGT